MSTNKAPQQSGRRSFISALTMGAAAFGLANVAVPAAAIAEQSNPLHEADEWFKKVKGTHRVVFDATRPHEVMPFAWPRVFLMTNGMTGSNENDCGVVVVLRHDAIPYAFQNSLWEKYKFGELFKANDPATNAPAVHNPFWQPKPGAFKFPGIGEVQLGINELQANGVMFCVCNAAMTLYSAVVAQQTNQDAATVKKEWDGAILPGIQPVPSGVWALGRAQEHKCAYIFAG
jgi:intracellular sulfur oxidation DsrE/DsrF family protein